MGHPAALILLIFVTAAVYSSIGHAGATGYLAAMALMEIPPAVMKPAALTLNVLVALITTVRYSLAGPIPWPSLWPIIAGSVPASFIGGTIDLPDRVFNPIVGAVLLLAAVRTVWVAKGPPVPPRKPGLAASLAVGAGIGFLSGLTGTGGSVFLSPLVLAWGWFSLREAAGVSAVFVLINSAAGLAGNLASVQHLPREIIGWGLAAVLGAMLGTELGIRHLSPKNLQYLLAMVIAVAGCKMLLAG